METEEKHDSASSEQDPPKNPYRLLFVLLVVLIICGGNGIGILSAAVLWKFTGAVTAAIVTAVVITLVAFACGMLVIVFHNRKK